MNDGIKILNSGAKPREVQAIPGKKMITGLGRAVPTYGVIRLVTNADGTVTPLITTWKPEIRLTTDIDTRLGIPLTYRMLNNLINAGFITARRPGPRTTLINIDSLLAHLKASEDPEFWTEKRIARYQEAAAEKP